ncbi:mechanosensitive ion channel [Sneathiella sp. P13V-1]|uniref:mechanosensitive ion channel domain-containing protein n=1 Tax=Sneathiella sp. P13V-1 TaxID=2697366 RepID=UPI00187B7142|nr:DUF3772 domain-containing protein [Sneathiella sp. P13V-1]MBE7636312.1 mechanosensitive ion channel [Sneathiella sp. P13V-1]
MKFLNRVFLIFCTFICLTTVSAFAQGQQERNKIAVLLKQEGAKIESLDADLSTASVSEKRLLEISKKLRQSREFLSELEARTKPLREDAEANLQDLGPAPEAPKEGESQVTEPESIQKQRKDLTSELLEVEGLYKQVEILTSRVSRLLAKVASVRRDRFVGQLFEKQTPLYRPQLWVNAIYAYRDQFERALKWVTERRSAEVMGGGAVLIAFFIFLSVAVKATSRKFTSYITAGNKFSGASKSLLFPVFAAVLGVFLAVQSIKALELFSIQNQSMAYRYFGLVLLVVLVSIGAKRFKDAGVIRPIMRWLVTGAGALFILDALLLESGRAMGVALDLAIAQTYLVTFVFSLILGVCSFLVLKDVKEADGYFFPKQLFYILAGIALCLIVSNLFSYAAFSRYLFEKFVILCTLFVVVLMLRSIAQPYFKAFDKYIGRSAASEAEQDDREHLVFFWLSLCLDVILFFLCLPIVANSLGADWRDIQEWTLKAFFGFEIGSFHISVANVGIAILVFIAFLLATRVIQRILDQKILPKTKLDDAIRQSITQVLGYVGLIIALMAGISALGFDLTNLALIAGALSVGIGFGLQSIVSNFVSGLILLFERPIKVNDWIITNSGEGNVKKISVRSTEIETFDRTSIIVPNSELISSSVKNWTHKDKMGRVIISVGVSYNSDPHQVKDLLAQCVKNNSDAMSHPEPSVFFMDFADSALMFEVRFFVRNIREVFRISTDMRLQIWDVFKEHDIEISFPQRDIHIRSAEGLKGLPIGE